MRVTLHQLRTVLLAQSVEQMDAGRTLVSQADLDDATRTAVAAARQRGTQRVGVGDVVLERADAIARRASGQDTTLAALREPHGAWRWAARGLPLLALATGLAIDRIANAHRVDLLSPPLLIVLAWNVCVYLLLAWRAWRPSATAQPSWQSLRHLASRLGTGRGRGLAARIAADFQARWWARTAGLQAQRAARVLHLCAAAWGAGIALSLLLRGLVVRYQFGWESTFLDAAQVHTIVSVLFWPVHALFATLFGLAPFTLQEIAATQNFAGEGAGGSRWVWMYVGLLTLVVVLPRLALAAWARWREARWQARLDPSDAAFDALRASLPGDLVIGLHGGPEAQVLQGAAVQTPQGDRLQFGDARQPVDAVLAWAADAPPPAWQGAPLLSLRWEDFGASWVLEPALFDRLASALPAQQHALHRLRAAWVERNELRFHQSLQVLARHLRDCAHAGPAAGSGDAAARYALYAQQVQALDAVLRALHGQPAMPTPQESTTPPRQAQQPALRRASPTALAVGTSAGAAAGAAAGAKAGALIDIGTGGLTLGAGTALGALLGGTTAWVLRSVQRKDDANELVRHATEAACTHYLVIAHVDRVPPADAATLAERWRAEVTGTVAAHGDALAAALRRAGPDDDAVQAVQALLHTMLSGILRRSFAHKGGGIAAAPAPPVNAA